MHLLATEKLYLIKCKFIYWPTTKEVSSQKYCRDVYYISFLTFQCESIGLDSCSLAKMVYSINLKSLSYFLHSSRQ